MLPADSRFPFPFALPESPLPESSRLHLGFISTLIWQWKKKELQKQNKNLVKEPGSNFRIPMHQDKPYWQMQADARENVGVCWVPLDKVTKESGPMRYVRGSHRWGKIFAPSDFVSKNGIFKGTEYLHRVPEDVESNPDLVTFDEAEPGDVIVHNWMTRCGNGPLICGTGQPFGPTLAFIKPGDPKRQRLGQSSCRTQLTTTNPLSHRLRQ